MPNKTPLYCIFA